MEELLKKFLGEKLLNLAGKGIDKITDEISHIINNNILEYLAYEYQRNSNIKTLLHRSSPVNLLDIYQPLYIIPSRNWHEEAKGNKKPTASIKELFKEQHYLTLKGTAGSGKSTIVRYLFINAIVNNYKIPIKVELRYLNDYDNTIIEYIKEKIFKFQNLANSDAIIERLMKSGEFIFFLDGYDEIVSNKKEKITKEIDNLVKRYNKNDYMVTSRPFTEVDLLPLFINYDVCNLTDNDIDEFIQKQFPKEEEELSIKIIEAVHNQENQSYKSFLKNPLLLSMFILTFQSYSNIPQKRSEFYNQVFETLYTTHDSVSKMAYVREKQSGLSKDNMVDILKRFSYISYFEEKFVFTLPYFNEKIQYIKDKKGLTFDNYKLLQDLQVAIGIITQEGCEYTYPHRSLQEYFTALYISSLSTKNKEIVYQKIYKLFFDQKEREIDNFYLILLELDKRAVISYLILPFLKYSIDVTNNVESKDNKFIFDFYLATFNIFYTFKKLLEGYRLFLYIDKKNRKLWTESMRNAIGTKKEKIDEAINVLCDNNIKPFFINDWKTMLQKNQDRLLREIQEEDSIDADLINLI